MTEKRMPSHAAHFAMYIRLFFDVLIPVDEKYFMEFFNQIKKIHPKVSVTHEREKLKTL